METIIQDLRDSGGPCGRTLLDLTTLVGAAFILFHSIKLIWECIEGWRLYFWRQFFYRQNSLRKYGQWAVIVGSTDGIGQAMAKILARQGHSIVVVGRNDEKLANTKSTLLQQPGVGEVITVKIDLSDSSEANFSRVRDQIDPDNRDIGILINNAGWAPAGFRKFHKWEMESLLHQVNVNILSGLYFTHMILPGMLKRQRGLVVNVSSELGLAPIPFFAVYGPTKAFVNRFSAQLKKEYSSSPVDIVNVTTGPVCTKMLAQFSAYCKPTIFSPTASYWARTFLNAIPTGISNFSGCLVHGIMYFCYKKLDYFGLDSIIYKLHIALNTPKGSEITPKLSRKQKDKSKTDELLSVKM